MRKASPASGSVIQASQSRRGSSGSDFAPQCAAATVDASSAKRRPHALRSPCGVSRPVRTLTSRASGWSRKPQFSHPHARPAVCSTSVLHQAAWGSVPRSIEMPLLYEGINIRGTLNMMEAARQCGVKKFVYASSSSVYGDHPVLPKKEGQEGKLLSPYAVTKRVNEEYGRLYKELYGLDTYGLRYFNVFGRRQDPHGAYAAVIPKFIKQLMNDEQPTINGDGKQSRDFTYIENVIEANLKACLAPSDVAGQAFNVAYGGREYLIDIYYELCKALGKDIEPIFGPDRPGDIKHSNADISRARELLGYAPEWSFERGIKAAIEWYKGNL